MNGTPNERLSALERRMDVLEAAAKKRTAPVVKEPGPLPRKKKGDKL